MRLTKWAAHLYPRWWRERYGEEFAALLEDARPGVGGALDVAKGALTMQMSTWSAKRVISLGALAGLFASGAFLLLRTPQYRSGAILEAPDVASRQEVADKVNAKSLEVFDQQKLSVLLKEFNLYLGDSNVGALDKLRKNIRVTAVGNNKPISTFKIEYTDPDPHKAFGVAKRLADSYGWKILEEASIPERPAEIRTFRVLGMGLGAGALLSGLLASAVAWRHRRQFSTKQG